MKNGKSTFIIILSIIMVLPFINGCLKKGSDDPFVSIYTRKARIVGEWTIETYFSDVKTTVGEDDSNQTRTVLQIDGLNWDETFYILGTDSIRETEGTILQYKYKFDKNGYFQSIYEYEIVESKYDEEEDVDTTITTTSKHEFNGTWNFLGGIDDYQNKERLALVITEEKVLDLISKYIVSEDEEGAGSTIFTSEATTRRFANGEMSTIWTLRSLKNKEILMNQNINTFYVQTINGSGVAVTNVGYQDQKLIRE